MRILALGHHHAIIFAICSRHFQDSNCKQRLVSFHLVKIAPQWGQTVTKFSLVVRVVEIYQHSKYVASPAIRSADEPRKLQQMWPI